MVMKFDRSERKAMDDLTSKLRSLHDEINAKIEEFNNEADRFAETRDGALDRIQGEWDEKSERWQEGERGQAVSEWMDEVRNVEFEPLEQVDAEYALDALDAMNYSPQDD